MIRFFAACIVTASLVSCNKSNHSTDKFSDPIRMRISDLQDRRQTDSLLMYIRNEEPVYRKEAVLAFASVQDSSAVVKIAELLNDENAEVRQATAFAIGQIRCRESEKVLQQALSSEKDNNVLSEILESIGKVTTTWAPFNQLDMNDTSIATGVAWSLYRAGLNGSVDSTYNTIAANLIKPEHKTQTRLGAIHFFSRSARKFDLFAPVLFQAANDPDPEIRMAAIYALRRIKTDESLALINETMRSDSDYRVRVNAVKALPAFPFEKIKEALFLALRDKNVSVAIAASESVRSTATKESWIELANIASELKNWRVQANIYQATLRVTENNSLVAEIKSMYAQSKNPYQKAALLTALQESTYTFEFIQEELFKADTPVIKSTAASALVEINRSPKFPASANKRFAEIYTKALQDGDAAVVGTIAGILADSTKGYRGLIPLRTLHDARKNLVLPRDIEVLQALESALAYFERTRLKSPAATSYNHPIDWELVKQIPKDQLVVIKTSKGNITIKLLIEEAPGSVANFVSLVKQNYFDQKVFHRVVPNFVIQDGCKRGDGSGGENYTIRSEFSQRRYKTGTVGMASSGKDTEGTQWFITHSPTPHLDGRYSIFGEVEKGIEVVHQIEVSDRIIDVELINFK